MKDEQLNHTVITLRNQNWSIRRISKELQVGRARIRGIIELNTLVRNVGAEAAKKPAKPRGSKLDQYKEYIGELLDTYIDNPPTGERIFEMIKERGYAGGHSILLDYLVKTRGAKAKKPIVCVESPAGEKAAHDWSEYKIEFSATGKKEKVHFFSFILHYSRRQYIEIVEDRVQSTLFRCLIHCFEYFNGVPLKIKSDNQKVCVDRWEMGQAVFNKKYLEFATHYHFQPLAIHPGKPTENLKIERPFYYLETNFLNSRQFQDKEDLKKQLLIWLTGTNDTRIHRTTNRSPIEMYTEELPYLQALPTVVFDTSELYHRIVNKESRIEYEGYFYGVASKYIHQTLSLKVTDKQLDIYTIEGERIKSYPLAAKGSDQKYVGEPLPKLESNKLDTKELMERLSNMGDVMQQFVSELKQHKSTYLHHLKHIVSLTVNYHQADVLLAVSRALRFKVYESGAIENFLKVNATKRNEIEVLPHKKHAYE